MQIFPRSLNMLPLVVAVAGAVAGGVLTFAAWYYFSPKFLQVGYQPEQPVPYSHRLHVQKLGMDCRYCHSNVESSPEAMLPATQTCMGCHASIRTQSARLAPVRQSWETGEPIAWVRIHRLPDHAFFDHSVHLSAGVGCASCHGRIDQMDVVRQDQPLSMAWCLECHRDPQDHLRLKAQGDAVVVDRANITNMAWTPPDNQAELAAKHLVTPPEHCSGCHR